MPCNPYDRYRGLVPPRKWTWLDYYLKNYSPTMKVLGMLLPGSGFDMSQIKTPEERAAERAKREKK
jgi:hypothetical protein